MLNNLRMAFKALLQNRVQALLTLSGMSVGIAMVVIVSGLGRGAQLSIENQIESAGPTRITVRAGNFIPTAILNTGGESAGGEVSEGILAMDPADTLASAEDDAAFLSAREKARAVKKTRNRSPAWPLDKDELMLLTSEIDNVRAVAASVSGNVTLDRTLGKSVRIAKVYGFQPAWAEMGGWSVLEGRFISDREHSRGDAVVLVSAAAGARLWPGQSALKQTLSMAGRELQVVGVIDDGQDAGSTIIVPTVYVPLAVAQHLLKQDHYDEINVRSTSVATTTAVAKQIQESMRSLRRLPEDTVDDFRVQTQSVNAMPSMGVDPRMARAYQSNIVEFEQESWEEMANSLRQAGRTFSLLLAGAAAVSLLVGGIGVMNIMLVSVAARTREIGLRMALGARMQDVMIQFMVEAVTLAAVGGVLGLLLGTIALFGAEYGMQWATAISPTMLVVAVAMAALTGMVFGYGPARRAASLDPVVALKSE